MLATGVAAMNCLIGHFETERTQCSPLAICINPIKAATDPAVPDLLTDVPAGERRIDRDFAHTLSNGHSTTARVGACFTSDQRRHLDSKLFLVQNATGGSNVCENLCYNALIARGCRPNIDDFCNVGFNIGSAD